MSKFSNMLLKYPRGSDSLLQRIQSSLRESNNLPAIGTLSPIKERAITKLQQLLNNNKQILEQVGVPIPISLLSTLITKFVSEQTDEAIEVFLIQLNDETLWVLDGDNSN